MRISNMLLLASFILTVGGIGKRSLKSMGIDRKHALFFLFCVFILNKISAELTDDVSFSAACLMIPIWLFGHLYSSSSNNKLRWIVLPLSAAAGAISCFIPKHIFILVIIEGMIVSALLDPYFSMAFSGIMPVFAYTAAYILNLFRSGYGTLELTEGCLTAQLIGIIISVTVHIIKESSKKKTARTYKNHLY